jgi:hypothetical protein
METMFTDCKCSSPVAVPDPNCCAQRSEGVSNLRAKVSPLGILRAKVSLDGWECGEGERTLLRQIDHGEDDGGVLRVDFRRLRGVLHTCET